MEALFPRHRSQSPLSLRRARSLSLHRRRCGRVAENKDSGESDDYDTDDEDSGESDDTDDEDPPDESLCCRGFWDSRVWGLFGV